MACRSDAGKFCAEHIGKPPQMNACLKANKANLSDACRKVVEFTAGNTAGIASATRVSSKRIDQSRSNSLIRGDSVLTRLGGEGLPGLGHFPDFLLDRLQILLARLTETALLVPALAAFGPPLFDGRPFHVGVTRSGEGFLRRGGLFPLACSAGFAGWRH